MQIPSESDTFQSLLWINRVSSMAETTSWSDGSVGHKWWWWQEGDARFVISISGTRESPGEDFLLHSAGSARVTFIPRSRVIIWALKSIFCVTVCRFHSHMGPSVPHTGTVTWQLRSGYPRGMTWSELVFEWSVGGKGGRLVSVVDGIMKKRWVVWGYRIFRTISHTFFSSFGRGATYKVKLFKYIR